MSTMNFHLRLWKQKSAADQGNFIEIHATEIPSECSFLEMLDIVNNRLTREGKEPVSFASDCREGICGTCHMVINGVPQGPGRGAACQVYMRKFTNGQTITVEPFRAGAFPIVKDLVVNRSAYDRIIRSGGFISEHTGGAPDASATLIPKPVADAAMDAAACIGCGACAAACPNSSAMLFVGAKVTHLGLLPQGQAERKKRARSMVRTMQEEGFGNCSNYYACEAVCPAGVKADVIAMLNRDYIRGELSEAVGAID